MRYRRHQASTFHGTGFGAVFWSPEMHYAPRAEWGPFRIRPVPSSPAWQRLHRCRFPGSPFRSLGVGCRWQAESWWGLRGSCCQELGSGSGTLRLLSKTRRAVVKEESSPSIKSSLSSSWRPELPSAVGLTISLTHLHPGILSKVPKRRGIKT